MTLFCSTQPTNQSDPDPKDKQSTYERRLIQEDQGSIHQMSLVAAQPFFRGLGLTKAQTNTHLTLVKYPQTGKMHL